MTRVLTGVRVRICVSPWCWEFIERLQGQYEVARTFVHSEFEQVTMGGEVWRPCRGSERQGTKSLDESSIHVFSAH